jgi:VWFA-related protein
MVTRILSCGLTLTLALAAPTRAASHPASLPGAGPDPAVASGSSPLVLDLVVRDKKGVPIADLRAEEVELYEDGVKREFEGFRHVTVQRPAAGSAAGATAESARLVVFLFPRLSGGERDLAQNAADEFLKKQLGPGMAVAVLVLGAELVPIQGFTPDATVLKDAVRRALDPSGKAGDPDVRAAYSLVQWLKGQPGRKTVLLFSSGLSVPSGFEDSFQQLVGLANRHQISFYGVDPRGVEVSRGAMRIEQEREADTVGLGGAGPQPTTGVTVQKSTRVGSDVQGYGQSFGPQGPTNEALAKLAQGTGGFALERTNSFSKGMRQIAEDVTSYYELTYTPAAAKAEGEMRGVDVKITREGAKVQARQGYAVGEAAAALVPAFEKRLAEALSADRLANDLEVWDRVLHFAWDGKEMTHVLSLAVPLEKVTLTETKPAGKEPGRFDGDVAVLARVKDASGQVVSSFSQRFPVGGQLDQMARAHALSIPFIRRVKLAPGEYTLETAVQDRRGEKLATRRTPFKVQAPQGIAISSLSLGDLLPAGTGSDPDDPLRVGNQRLVPNLGQPIKAGQPTMTLHAVIYPQAGSKAPANIAITLLLGGQPANRATAVLPAPDAGGRIPYATAFKMDVLPPGSYRFDVAVTQGPSRAEESLPFTIVP